MDNSTRPDSPLPPLFNPTAESVLQDVETTISATRSLWDSIVKEVRPETATIDNTIIPVAHNENESKLVTDIIYLYATTHPSQEVRESSKKATRIVAEAEVDQYLRDDMFQLVDAVMNKTNEGSTDPETYRFLQKYHVQFLKNGCDLRGKARAQFESDLKRLGKAVQDYKSNLDNDSSGLWLSREELDGLPTSFLDGLRQGETDNGGKLWVNMKRAHSTRLLKYAKSEATRQRYFTALYNRMPHNIPLAREIIFLRDSLARQKGHNSWAQYKMSEKMINRPEKAIGMLKDLHSKLAKIGDRDAEELLMLKKADIEVSSKESRDTRLFLWDISFYENMRQERAASVNNALIMEYFEVKTVLRKILDLYERLFEIKFELVTPTRADQLHGESSRYSTWHEDVVQFLVWDTAVKSESKRDAVLGHVFFDLYSRQGKFSHAGQLTFQKASEMSTFYTLLKHIANPIQAFEKADGSRTYPSSAIVMNYAKPSDAKPLLMSVMEVRSLFHEIGHSMHALLSITKFARFHGTRYDCSNTCILNISMFEGGYPTASNSCVLT